MGFFANLFGYVLKFLYDLVGNYGIAIILFSILVKLAMLPLTFKQQKTLKKNEKIQKEMKQIQFKYKNDQEMLNKEIMELYKREGMMPLSGCFTSIIQILLLLSVFLLVRSPLTYMVKMDTEVINKISSIVIEKDPSKNNAYKEISIIQYVRNLQNEVSVSENEISEENKEENKTEEINNKVNENNVEENVVENKVEEDKSKENTEDSIDINKYIDDINLNMDFFGIDLSQVPTNNINDWKTLIIPVLYVITSFISIRLTSQATAKKKNEKNKLITDGTEENKEEQYNPTEDVNKTMTWMMPIMSVSIAIIAPLGLALYWLMNNILMIIEKLVFDKILKKEEEANSDA